MSLLAGNGVWALISQSDAISTTVLLTLFGASIFSWTVALYKFLILRRREAEVAMGLKLLSGATTMDAILAMGQNLAGTMPGIVITRLLGATKQMLVAKTETKKELTRADLELVHQEVESAVYEVMGHEESYMAVLKTTAEVGPLLGLLGTVWGLIHAFMRISQEQSADIITVAPGIAEALITTLVGLVVAIPALVFFNILQRRIHRLEQNLILFADKSERAVQAALVQRELL